MGNRLKFFFCKNILYKHFMHRKRFREINSALRFFITAEQEGSMTDAIARVGFM